MVKAERDEHDRQVVLASVQTLARPARLERLAADFTTVVVDEAHHATAETYRRVLSAVQASHRTARSCSEPRPRRAGRWHRP